MRHAIRGIAALLALVPLSIASVPAAPTPIAQTGEAERGAEFFTEFGCYQCHLYSGHGYTGAPGGASLIPMTLTEDGFIAYIRNPATPRRMPPYSRENLTDEEAADIYAFIRTFPQSREAGDIPLLREILEENQAGRGPGSR